MATMSPKQKKGLFFTLLYSLLVIVLIFIIGFDYKLIDYRWTTQGPWRHLAAVSCACVVVIFFSAIISFVAFVVPSTPLLIFFVVFQSLSMCLSFGISVMSFLACSPGSIDDYIGCHSQLKGFVEFWNSIDHYLIGADQLLCSNDCKCKMNEKIKEQFRANIFFQSDFWKFNNNDGKEQLQTCDTDKLKNLNDAFTKTDIDSYSQLVKDFNEKQFWVFWANMEKRFNCTGWCTTSYDYPSIPIKDSTIHQQGLMIKFLFNNINDGIPQNIGCMGEFIKYVKRMVKTYSSCLIIACFFQILTFILGLSILCERKKSKTEIENQKTKEEALQINKRI